MVRRYPQQRIGLGRSSVLLSAFILGFPSERPGHDPLGLGEALRSLDGRQRQPLGRGLLLPEPWPVLHVLAPEQRWDV